MGEDKRKEPGYCMADPMLYGLLKQFANENRQKETPAEMLLWQYLRRCQLGVNFRRQHIIGDYIADFACLPLKLIIELDGGYHQLPTQMISDVERTRWLANRGFEIVRLKNEEVLGDIEGTINKIKKLVNKRE